MIDTTAPESTPPVEEEPSPLRIAVGFFILPLLLVLVGVGVFLLFGVMAHDDVDPAEYLPEILGRGINEPWQAAFHLSQRLQYDDSLRGDEGFARQVIDALEGAGDADPRVRRFLVVALGRLDAAIAVPTLVRHTRDEDAETRLNALWALGTLGAREAAPAVAERLADDDVGVRTMAAYVLGVLRDPATSAALRARLADPVPAVRWNAAVALGLMADASARPVLARMIDRGYLASVPGVTQEEQAPTMLAALRALETLGPAGLERQLAALRDADPDLRVRDAAGRALAAEHDEPADGSGPLLAEEQ